MVKTNMNEYKNASPILIVSQLPPPVHGANIMTQLLLSSLNRIDCRYCVLERKLTSDIKSVGRFSFRKLLKVPIIAVKLLIKIFKYKPKFCIYFLSVKYPTFFMDAFFLYVLKIFKIKYALYLHGVGLKKLSQSKYKFLNGIVINILKNSYSAIILSKLLKNDVYPFIHHKNIFILNNAIPDIDTKRINYAKHISQKIKILSISNLRPSKGTLDILIIASLLKNEFKNIKFILAGPFKSESFKNQILSFINNENLENYVELVGVVNTEEKEKLYENCHIFLYPTHNDAFPLVNLEAMQFGLPIISSNVGAIPEMIDDGVNGFVVHSNDLSQFSENLKILINDAELRIKMGKCSRQIYEQKYSIDTYRENLEKLVMQLN